MTAIYGLVRAEGRDAAPELSRMGQVLARYGRGRADQWSDHEAGVGIRNSFFLPEDRFYTEIRGGYSRYAVVADAHLSERAALAEDLQLGAAATSLSDAALVAAAIERWHEDAFDRIYGSFAVAAWDIEERRLLLASDHLGSRPLFYFVNDDGCGFASMPEGLHVLADVPRRPDEEQVARLLRAGSIAYGRTCYVGVRRVMSGHKVVIRDGQVASARYWTPDLTPLRLASQQDYVDKIGTLLDRAVANSLRGVDGVVGTHLSGGFDSTAVTVTAARQMAARGGKVIALTAAPRADRMGPDAGAMRADEWPLAAATARMHANVEHVRVEADAALFRDFDRASTIYGMPTFNPCCDPWFDAVNDAARARGVRIVLEGSMGNLSISESGTMALHHLFRTGRLREWLGIARGLVGKGWMRWRGVLWSTLEPYAPDWLYVRLEALRGEEYLDARRCSGLRPSVWDEVTRTAVAENESLDPLDRTYLEQVDRVFDSVKTRLLMAADDSGGAYSKAVIAEWGLDVRDPTADRRLIEFALRVPVERLIHGGEPRAILKAILRDAAAEEVLNSRRKGHQGSDWQGALVASRDEIADQVERIAMFEPSEQMIDVDRLRRLIADWPEPDSPRWNEYGTMVDYRFVMLRSISAANFMRKAAGSNY